MNDECKGFFVTGSVGLKRGRLQSWPGKMRSLWRCVFSYLFVSFSLLTLASCSSQANVARPSVGSTTSTTSQNSVSTTSNPAPNTLTYGIDVNQFDGDIGSGRVPQVLAMIHQAGAGAVRIGGDWPTIEPASGQFNFTSVDRLFSLARTDGLVVLLELGNEPAWDAIGGNESAPPIDCDAANASCTSVANYVTALVTHTAPEGLQYLIIRNEPQNFNKNWVGGSALAYAHFQAVAYEAAHRADPGIKILSGGTESISASLAAIADELIPPTQYMTQEVAFSNTLYSTPTWCNSQDILDIHAGDHGPQYSPEIVDSSENALTACNGGRHIPVWVTEVGYPSIAALQSSHVYQVELGGSYQGGESGQAQYLKDTFTALKKDPNVIGIDWTFMIDPNTTDTVPPGTSYNSAFSEGIGAGLAYASYKTKAAYQTFQAITGEG